jgi:chromosome segregation ATPase
MNSLNPAQSPSLDHSSVTKSSSRDSIIHFGRPKPTREIRPSDIHEIRVETSRLQSQLRLQQTKLHRLKAQIINKTDAIERTVNQKSNDHSASGHKSAIVQLQRSVDSARNTLERLQIELESALSDDRTMIYRELEEELKVTYLEYDRLQSDIKMSNANAQRWEDELKEVDFKASPENLNELNRRVSETRAENQKFTQKWQAYEVKMLKMKIEARIAENRKNGKPVSETLMECEEEQRSNLQRLNRIAERLDGEDDIFRQRLQELVDLVDGQRRNLVKYLVGESTQQPVAP